MAAGALALAASLCATPATAQRMQPLAERTGQTDLPLDGPRAQMQLEDVRLGLTIMPESRSIAGDGTYTVRARQQLSEIAFDLDPRYTVSGVSVDGSALGSDAFANPEGLLTIRLPRPLSAGSTAEVHIEYAGRPHVARNAPWDGGFVWESTDQGQPWIATAIQGEGCDMFWPCIDHSSSRIGSMDTLITVPTGLVAAGNGRLVETQDNGDGTTTYHWTARDPSNYGIALNIAPYELAERQYESRYGNTIPIQFWHLPGNGKEARRLNAEMASYLDFFEEVIGPYPFADEKAGIAETPHLGMEHQTINAYGNRFRPDPLGYDWLLAHEFAHEWFANQLTHATINHMWLHEGIGTWMQPLYLGWAKGDMYYDAEMWRQRQMIRSEFPVVLPEGTLPDGAASAAGWSTDIYAKGAWVMHSLRYVVGEDVIFPALTRLVYGTGNPQPGQIAPVSRTSDDFRVILEEMTGDDLRWFFDAYLYNADLPRLVTRKDGRQVSFEWQTPSQFAFEMPLEVRMEGGIRTIPMTGGRGTMTLPDEDTNYLVDPRNQILMQDDVIANWQEGRMVR